jgi:hypothetical protein
MSELYLDKSQCYDCGNWVYDWILLYCDGCFANYCEQCKWRHETCDALWE